MKKWDCDVFDSPLGNARRPQVEDGPEPDASRDRNLRRRVARRLAAFNWKEARRWYKRAQIHAIMRPGLGGYTGPVPR